MLTKRFGLLQDADVDLGSVRLGEARQLDRARQSRWSGTNDENVQLHAVAGTFGTVLEN
jgi:hypothetical protein